MLTVTSEQLNTARDIIVTTPKAQMDVAAKEADKCIRANGGTYFRRFNSQPKHLAIGSRVFYVEDGHIRGFGVVSEVEEGNKQCETTGKKWGNGVYATMPANSWKWIKPIPMKGFQGYRYYDGSEIDVIGGWKDPKPDAMSCR